MPHIYKITSPKNKIYIGSSINYKDRWRCYRRLDCKKQHLLYCSLKKYGVENHKFEIVTECTLEEMYRLEATYGHIFDVLGKNGLNLSLPANDSFYINRHPDIGRKISLAKKGKTIVSKETREKMSESRRGQPSPLKGQKLSEETIKKLSLALKGRISPRKGVKLTTEQKQAISEGNKGNKSNARLVLNLETGIYYDSAKDACETTNYNPLTFVNMLNPKNKHINKTQFIFVDGGTKTEYKKSGFNNNNRGKMVINLETGIVHESAKEAYLTYPSISNKWTQHTFNGVLKGNTRPKNNTSFIYL